DAAAGRAGQRVRREAVLGLEDAGEPFRLRPEEQLAQQRPGAHDRQGDECQPDPLRHEGLVQEHDPRALQGEPEVQDQAQRHDDDAHLGAGHARSRYASRPTSRPARSPIARTAVRMPGMNAVVEKVSVRRVRASPSEPKRISSWAFMPCCRIAWTCTPSMTAPRAPSGSEAVASGIGPRPAAVRAAAMRRAVCAAVPEGASSLRVWWISTISAESK